MPKNQSQLLSAFAALMKIGGKHYVMPGVRAMQANMWTYYRIHLGRSRYYEMVKWLIDNGYITRTSRFDQRVQPRIKQLSGIIAFTKKGLKQLADLGNTFVHKLRKQISDWYNRNRASKLTNKTIVLEKLDREVQIERNLRGIHAFNEQLGFYESDFRRYLV